MPSYSHARLQLGPIYCVLALFLGSLAVAPNTQVLAQDDAHGGTQPAERKSKSDVHKPGPAVQATRITEAYTQPGMTLNPIAIDFDPWGNLYVVQAFRAGICVIDNRNEGLQKSSGVIDDLRKTSVEDRLKQMEMLEEKGFYPKGIFTKEADKVQLLKDTDGDGKADRVTIFADGFDDKLDGIAAGVLWHEGKVYLTNIPNLWLLEDKDGDGDADEETPGERSSLSYGYGIRWAFYGHDMHGLIKGPDGRIYFSIGDRGFNVTTKEGNKLYSPDRGGVLRMWPDGSGLEIFHSGLRNPQELAFDNYGNLFTGDNNCDAGDLARFVYVTEGGESGWNQDVQSLNDRGPWKREEMWRPRMGNDKPTQPAWMTHPIANVGRGPSGLAHYPGTGDVFESNGSFLMCDYPPGVRHVQLSPMGAGFVVTEDSVFVDADTITDVAWGYDGRLYLANWGGGWRPNAKGDIKTMVNKAAHEEQAEVIAEVKSLFANGFDKLSDKKLIELLGHRDQRVRLNAQWAFAGRENADPKDLSAVLKNDQSSELSKLHAIWALGMMARKTRDFAAEIDAALSDDNPLIRAQAIATLGDLGQPLLEDMNKKLLTDKSPVVQYHAAIALGKTGYGKPERIGPLLDLLERNDNNDDMIRHAAIYGLSLIGDVDAIHNQAKSRGPAARLGAVISLRRLSSPLVAEYLGDKDVLVAAEAARAIYDKRMMDVMPALAALGDTIAADRMIEPIMRRVIEANVRLADTECATRLGRIAANDRAPEAWRLLALEELDKWSAQRDREGVWGSWWPRPEQGMGDAAKAMLAYLPQVISHSSGKVQTLARTLMQRHVVKSSPQELAALVLNTQEPAALRLGAVQLLADADKALAISTAKQLIPADPDDQLRINVRAVLIGLDQEAGQTSYAAAIKSGTLLEQQDAIGRLSGVKGEITNSTMIELSDALSTGSLAPGLRLEVIEAISENQALPPKARANVLKYLQQNQLPGEGPFIRDSVLAGGSIERGRDVFENNEAASCVRCHRMDDQPGAGPNLSGVGALHDVNYLYTALVHPSRDIADGFATSSITLKNGESITGRILATLSNANDLVLANADGVQRKIPRDQLAGHPLTSDQSLMPTMTDKLSARELRDVLAFLGSLREPTAAHAHGGAGHAHGPEIINPAKNISHAVLLPLILLGIAGVLGLILLPTVLGGRV